MITVSQITGDHLREDPTLLESIVEILRPSYQDPSAIYEREVAACTTAYLGVDSKGMLRCFFLTSTQDINSTSGEIRAVHLGLSATDQSTKNSGLITPLYFACINDVIETDGDRKEQSVLWSTTASPTIYLGVSRLLKACEPKIDGSYSESGAVIAGALRRYLGAGEVMASEHPFVLRDIASGTLYSDQEKRRINRVERAKNFDLFKKLSVKEDSRDRLLFIARTPDRRLSYASLSKAAHNDRFRAAAMLDQRSSA